MKGVAKLKTHLRGARVVLRSKTPKLVRQESEAVLHEILEECVVSSRGRRVPRGVNRLHHHSRR